MLNHGNHATKGNKKVANIPTSENIVMLMTCHVNWHWQDELCNQIHLIIIFNGYLCYKVLMYNVVLKQLCLTELTQYFDQIADPLF